MFKQTPQCPPRMIVSLACFVLLFQAGCLRKGNLEDSLDTLALDYTLENTPPGLSVSVIERDAIVWSYSYGFADIDRKTPMDGEVIMNIASVSKTITATAVLQLWEKGLLDIDYDVNTYLDFPVRNPNFGDSPITIKQLLTHTASIKDSPVYGDSYKCGDPEISLADWLGNYFRPDGKFYSETDNFYTWEPGAQYQYSNVGYGLLGLLVEKVSGQAFNAYCREHITVPLKMDYSAWFISETDTLKQAKQYSKSTQDNVDNEWLDKLIKKQTGEYLELCNYSFYNYPDGLFKSTISDLSHFLIAIMNRGNYQGNRILQEATVANMLSLQITGNDIQGLGWKKIYTDTTALWGHSGRDPGIRTHMYFNPETETGLILFQNNGDGTTIELVKDIFDLLAERGR
ncbi:serine hydrolase domain-containing protein [Robiginitalea sp. IMCC44478]|uniref:serine hydrolase domain-containing protein n=1 Tax=Robiginitalea sp. IMCC44478 TaxID=3459122 RepID=UPI00404272C8